MASSFSEKHISTESLLIWEKHSLKWPRQQAVIRYCGEETLASRLKKHISQAPRTRTRGMPQCSNHYKRVYSGNFTVSLLHINVFKRSLQAPVAVQAIKWDAAASAAMPSATLSDFAHATTAPAFTNALLGDLPLQMPRVVRRRGRRKKCSDVPCVHIHVVWL